MPSISDKHCPYCHAISNVDVPLDNFAYIRQSEDTTDKENEKKRNRYFKPESLIASSKYYTKIYQCPCCKKMYEYRFTADQRTWEIRCEELLEEYKNQGGE